MVFTESKWQGCLLKEGVLKHRKVAGNLQTDVDSARPLQKYPSIEPVAALSNMTLKICSGQTVDVD